MQFRNATDADIDSIAALIEASGPSIDTATPVRFKEHLALGSYRPAWMWLAESGGRLVGAAIFWGRPQSQTPLSLDGLIADASAGEPTGMWTLLVQLAMQVNTAIDYHIFLPSNWREDESIAASLPPRLAAARAAGLTEVLERYRYEWIDAVPVPARSTRLSFRPEPSDDAWVDIFARVADGSLDITTQAEVRALGATGYARADLALYKDMPAPREWWRLAYNNAGELVGFGIPSRNQGGPVVGFLGVLPVHRGRGYVDDILAEITADLAVIGAERIVADTDATNLPMAAAFERAGYHRFGVRLVASRPVP